MKNKHIPAACLITLIALVLNFQLAFAHEHITVGDYEISVGWVNEPPVAGQANGIEIGVSNISTGEEQPVEDISSLTVTISYGGQSRELALEALGEDNPGQFEAPILPTIPGQYTITFGGQLGDTPVDAQVEPEEVAPADTIQFPAVEASIQSADLGMMNWLIYISLLVGMIALVLGVMALRKPR